MRALQGADELRGALARVKAGATKHATNFYATPATIDDWIRRGELTIDERHGAALLLRHDQGFHHLYYAAPDRDALAAALGDRDAPWRGGTLTCDLVGRPAALGPVVDVFEGAGFERYTSLTRMSRAADPTAPDDFADPEVVVATPDDAPAVQAFLARLLDPYSEQLPTTDELRAAASAGGLLVVRRGEDDLGGILFFETMGVTSVLRYWFVNDRFRNQGIGSRLIKTFFRMCQTSRRIVLWVIADNHDSIAKYEHYRFRPEGLVDHIMIREGDGA